MKLALRSKPLPFIVFVVLFVSLTSFVDKGSKEKISEMQRNIDKIIASIEPNANVGIEIISLKNGSKIYQHNASNLFVPASCQKLFTGGAALSLLGVDYQFTTGLWTQGKIKGKTLEGDLYIKGSGDPELSIQDVEDIIFQIKLMGIHKISGAIYVDNFDFDGVSQGPGWMWDDEPEFWNSPVDALTVNHSCMDVWISPSQESDGPAKILVHPKTSFVQVENFTRTKQDVQNDVMISRRVINLKNIIKIEGGIDSKSEPMPFQVSIEHPALYTGHVLQALMNKHGVVCKGPVELKEVPQKAALLAEHKSRSLSLIVQQMMKESDNLYADCIFKKIGQVRYEQVGSWKNGSKAVREFLANKAGIDIREMVLLDGSGLSRYNLTSPHQIVQFLREMRSDFSIGSEFLSSLSISGVDGTLKERFVDASMQNKVRAKSGGMKGIRNLSGYVVMKDGEELIFSILINGIVQGSDPKRAALEVEICKYLAECE